MSYCRRVAGGLIAQLVLISLAAVASASSPQAAAEKIAGGTQQLLQEIDRQAHRIDQLENYSKQLEAVFSAYAAEHEALPQGDRLCRLGATVNFQPTWVADLAEAGGFEQVLVIYQHNIDPDDDAVLNADLLEAAVIATIPEGFAGEAVLDWEGKALELSRGPPGDAQADAARAQLIAALDLADSLRPDASWSIYGLVPRYRPDSWIEGDAKWSDWLVNLAPVLDRSESICLTLYRFYKDEQQAGKQASSNATTDWLTIAAAREIAGSRVLLAFFMDVYHDGGTQPHKGQPMHVVEMQQAVRHFAHCGVDLVVWWRQQKEATAARSEYIIRSWVEAVAEAP